MDKDKQVVHETKKLIKVGVYLITYIIFTQIVLFVRATESERKRTQLNFSIINDDRINNSSSNVERVGTTCVKTKYDELYYIPPTKKSRKSEPIEDNEKPSSSSTFQVVDVSARNTLEVTCDMKTNHHMSDMLHSCMSSSVEFNINTPSSLSQLESPKETDFMRNKRNSTEDVKKVFPLIEEFKWNYDTEITLDFSNLLNDDTELNTLGWGRDMLQDKEVMINNTDDISLTESIETSKCYDHNYCFTKEVSAKQNRLNRNVGYIYDHSKIFPRDFLKDIGVQLDTSIAQMIYIKTLIWICWTQV